MKRRMPVLLVMVLTIVCLLLTAGFAETADQNFNNAGLGDKFTQSYTLDGVVYTTNDSIGWTINIVNDGNIATGGDLALGYRSSGYNSTTQATFRSLDGSEFKLNSFVISTGVGNPSVAIEGYRNGDLVAASSINTFSFVTFDVSGNPDWQNIDEVRMKAADLDIDIDDIDFSPAISPSYTVTYSGNGNSGGAVPTDGTSYHAGDAVTVMGNTGSLTKTGYTFAGWNTAANGSGTSYTGGDTFAMGSSNVTLYAQWTAVNYTVTYNGNTHTGGAVPIDGNIYNITDTVTVLGNTGSLVKTGYTFAGWDTAANGSGTSYTGGDTFAMGSSNVTLYAQWLENTYTVTYSGNGNTGGAVPTDGTSYHVGDTATVLGNTGSLIKTGYTFAGWNPAANGTGTTYTGGDTFAMGSGNVTLFAQWFANNYTVTYDGNTHTGGAVPIDGNIYNITDTVTVLGNTGSLVKTGYTFAGWDTAANGSGTNYTEGDYFFMGNGNVTLYAQWMENIYTVTYSGNGNTGGAVPTDGTVYHTTDTATVLGNTGSLVKTGNTFARWNTAANGSGTSYTGGDTFAIATSNVTLYAQWTAVNYTVTYNGNTHTGGAVPIDGNIYNITDAVTVLGNTGNLVKTGYTFAGWDTAANGSGTNYTEGDYFFMGNGNVTLYAQWMENIYTVTYSGNGNTGGAVPTDGTVYHTTDTATVLGNTGSLVKTGNTFAGWNTAANGSGTSYTGGDTFAMGSSNVTLYAQWTAVNYTVTYNGNTHTGGAVPIDGNIYNITDTVTVLGNTGNLVKTGYTFAGWDTAANGSGTNYTEGDYFFMGNGNVTLYAQWMENIYTVTYSGNGNTGGAVPTDGTVYHTTDTATVLGNTGSLVKTGNTFAGWNTAANGSGTSYTGGDTFAIATSNVTLYAQWTAVDYTVTYDGNTHTGGAVPIDGNIYNITDAVTVLGNTGSLTKTSYSFTGWNTAANGSGTNYTGGDTFAMGSSNVILYAQWTDFIYTVTYDGNGNTGGTVYVDATLYQSTGIVRVFGNTGNLVKTGFTFDGWNTAANGSGNSYSADDTFVIGSGNVILYAQWLTQTVAYSMTDGDGTSSAPVGYSAANLQGSISEAVLLGGVPAGNTVELQLRVGTQPIDGALRAQFEQVAAGSTLLFMDLSLMRIVRDTNGAVDPLLSQSIPETDSLITVTIPVPEDSRSASEYMLLRKHGNGSVAAIPQGSANANANGEYFTLAADHSYITAYLKSFSPYAIAYKAAYRIIASAGTGGSISPSGSVSVIPGASRTFIITAQAGYEILRIEVDGVNIGAVTSHTFSNVRADHIITAYFTPEPGLPPTGDDHTAAISMLVMVLSFLLIIAILHRNRKERRSGS